MKKLATSIGIIGLLTIGWFLYQGSSIDYVATVDDELTKLERELSLLATDEQNGVDMTAARANITNRIDMINSSLAASADRTLSSAQEQLLTNGLTRLQRILDENQALLTQLDESDQSDGATIGALSKTVTAIQNYLKLPQPTGAESWQTATYLIDGRPTMLQVEGAPLATTSSIVTRYFGNEVTLDLNADGREDRAFLVTQTTGGSGTFYYFVGALDLPTGWVGTSGVFLGDRIAPQTTERSQNPDQQQVIVVNYQDRAPDESMVDQPSVGVSRWFKLDTKALAWGEVEVDFAGEADPSSMTLTMQPWTWVQTTYNDGVVVEPTQPQDFVLTFAADNAVTITTDCNAMSGRYEVQDTQITFSNLLSTKMFCGDSKEQPFTTMLGQVQSYSFTTKGELVFDLQSDSGSAVFR